MVWNGIGAYEDQEDVKEGNTCTQRPLDVDNQVLYDRVERMDKYDEELD